MRIGENNFIARLKAKDEKALDYVIDAYGWLVKTIVRKHLYTLENIQDECINDILLAIWNNINSFNQEKSSFKNWLGAVAKYKCIDYKRRYLKNLDCENIDDMNLESTANVEKEIIKNDIKQDIEGLLNSLKCNDKELFVKHYVEQKGIREIAEETGVKPSAIYNRLSRGRSKLRSVFSKGLLNFRGEKL